MKEEKRLDVIQRVYRSETDDGESRAGTGNQRAAVRRDAEQAVRHRGEQFVTLLNQAPLGLYLVDSDFRIREVNPAALSVFGRHA